MKIEFDNGDFCRVTVVGPGTAGIPYDCRVRAELRQGDFFGQTEAYLDGPDVKGFLAELDKVWKSLKGEASLQSDDGERFRIRIAPVDSLGHFFIEAKVARRYNQGRGEVSNFGEKLTSTSVYFRIESQMLNAIRETAIACFHENRDSWRSTSAK
jgi:hypothetical protein